MKPMKKCVGYCGQPSLQSKSAFTVNTQICGWPKAVMDNQLAIKHTLAVQEGTCPVINKTSHFHSDIHMFTKKVIVKLYTKTKWFF